ncbi:MAG: fumarylacetoacetate hydrolase family protein [Pseudomonadota bacterium]|nr:fumarylacetoacetate hydrolase family protein [Pseudomonadota bacterium]
MVWFALGTYYGASEKKSALVLDDNVYDLVEAYRVIYPKESGGTTWITGGTDGIMRDWNNVESEVQALAEAVAKWEDTEILAPLADGGKKLAAPIQPERIFGAAANYVEHANEMGTVLATKAESNPYVFLKADSSTIGPGDTVCLPKQSKMVDWEIELAVIIGRQCRHVDTESALDYVAGYSVINDITARDLNVRADYPFKFDWFQGKSFDTFAPLGPWIVPASCINDPQTLSLVLSINDEVMQDSSTDEMIYTVREQIAYLSSILTLRPGDVLATGTPTGVGMARGIFLKPGDVITASIENIGTLSNPVAAQT